MRPVGTTKQLEQRRRKAIALLKQGCGVRETARLIGASPSTVTEWRKAYEKQGEAFFQAHSPPGRPPGLSQKHKKKLQKLLLKGARANSYKTELWTLKRIAQIIRKHFGVHYQLSGIWYILSRLNWSCQKPEKRARERNEQAIETWRKKRWPYIKKRSKKR